MNLRSSGARPTWAEVNTTAISQNLRKVKSKLPAGTEVLAVVKANGYGHGSLPVSITALENGASALGVGLVEEGIALRRAGIAAPIVVLGTIFPMQAAEALKYGITCTVGSYDLAESLSSAAVAQGRKAKIHVEVDTGMGRLGLPPELAATLVQRIARLPGIEIEGIFTHLAASESNPELTRDQLGRFHGLTERLRREGYAIPIRHAANSAAALMYPDACFEMVRVGIAMYGLSPTGITPPEEFTPALSLYTKVGYIKPVRAGATVGYGATYVAEKDELIATLPIGYADGYSRRLSGRGEVLIDGARYRIAGRVCMDHTMISIPKDSGVDFGDEVVLIGSQGRDTIYAEDVARLSDTINYEIVCGIGPRVPRVYVAGNRSAYGR